MSHILAINSFRHAAGRSSLAANLCILLAQQGKRVLVIDSDFQAPGLHLLLNLPETEIEHTLNDYLLGKCQVQVAAYDLSQRLGIADPGAVHLLPASPKVGEIVHILQTTYDIERFSDGVCDLEETLELDYTIIDTAAGIREDSLPLIALAQTLVVLLRPDQQDYQGTAVTLEVARRLNVPETLLVLNYSPQEVAPAEIRQELQATYDCKIAALLPYSQQMSALASRSVLALSSPQAEYVKQARGLLAYLQ